MDGILFEEWFSDLDRKFASGGRNIALVIVSCPVHQLYKKWGYDGILGSKNFNLKINEIYTFYEFSTINKNKICKFH